jgi:aminopeptidase
MIPFRELISRNHTNWSVIATAGEAWAAKVFPNEPADQRFELLRSSIEGLCRLDRPDPCLPGSSTSTRWRRAATS